MAYGQEEWKEYKREHFVIYYQNAPLDFVKTIEDSAESYYREIAKNMGFTRYKGWTFDERASIYVYDSPEHFVESAKGAQWAAGHANPYNKTIRTFPSAAGFFDSTLPHELGHIVFREFVGVKPRVPLWFEEGVASYQEKAKRYGSNKLVLKAMENGAFIPLHEMNSARLSNNSTQETVTIFYAEAASAVYFLITEFGDYRFTRFCNKLKEGEEFEQALKNVYVRFKSVKDLNDAWVKYLKK